MVYAENHGFYPDFKTQLKQTTLINPNAQNHPDADYDYLTLTTTRNAMIGMSGGPLMDYQGRILGVASYIAHDIQKDFYMRLDVLDELIQKFNEKYN